MIKSIFSNLSRGFFYTIGKLIAFVFIAFIIYYFFSKTGIDFRWLS